MMKKEPKKNTKVQTEEKYKDGQNKKKPKNPVKKKYTNLKQLYVQGELSEEDDFE